MSRVLVGGGFKNKQILPREDSLQSIKLGYFYTTYRDSDFYESLQSFIEDQSITQNRGRIHKRSRKEQEAYDDIQATHIVDKNIAFICLSGDCECVNSSHIHPV
jgi:hypothetical protein